MAPAKKRVRADTQVGPYRSSSSLHPIQKNGRGQRPVPTGLSWCQASGRCRHRPLRKGGAAATALASGAQRSVCAAVTRDGWRVRQRSPPKVSSNLGQSLSRLTATAPFAQGSLALRGTGERADTRVRPYVVIGIASSARRGGTEPAPYGSTGSAGLRADVPKAWPLPPKFRSEIWGVGHRHRPLRKDGNPDLLVPRGAATSHSP